MLGHVQTNTSSRTAIPTSFARFALVGNEAQVRSACYHAPAADIGSTRTCRPYVHHVSSRGGPARLSGRTGATRRGSPVPSHHRSTPSRLRPQRGPAPSRNFGKNPRLALPQAWLLRPLPSLTALPRSKILFGLVSSGVTTRAPAGSPAPAPAAPRRPTPVPRPSRSAPTQLSHVVTY